MVVLSSSYSTPARASHTGSKKIVPIEAARIVLADAAATESRVRN
jgi:hypothetical protein